MLMHANKVVVILSIRLPQFFVVACIMLANMHTLYIFSAKKQK